MRVELGSFTGVDTELSLPVEGDGPPKHLRLRELTSLSGVLERRDGALRLDDVRAGQVRLGAANWTFGSVQVRSPEQCVFEQVQLALETSDAPLEMDLHTSLVAFARLEIAVGDTVVSGVARMEGASLRLAHGAGTIRAERSTIQELLVKIGSMVVRVPQLEVRGLEVGWGEPHGFHMHAHGAVGPEVAVQAGPAHVKGTRVDLRGFEVKGGAISALSLEAQKLEVETSFDTQSSSPEAVGAEAPAREGRSVVDLGVLDALAGRLVADARFEVRLPGGLRRRLHVPLALEVEEGSIDYRALEHSLPTFEDSLLDFSRQDDWLVLELGLPLLPTRGRGKQLMRWPLRSADGTTTRGNQVRLSTLPRFERPSSRTSSGPASARESTSGQSAVWLDRASVKLGPMELQLPPPSQHLAAALELLTFEEACLEGEIEHQHGEAPAGELRSELRGLEARLDELGLGERLLDIDVTARHVRDLRVPLAGFKPRGLQLRADDVRLKGVAYR